MGKKQDQYRRQLTDGLAEVQAAVADNPRAFEAGDRGSGTYAFSRAIGRSIIDAATRLSNTPLTSHFLGLSLPWMSANTARKADFAVRRIGGLATFAAHTASVKQEYKDGPPVGRSNPQRVTIVLPGPEATGDHAGHIPEGTEIEITRLMPTAANRNDSEGRRPKAEVVGAPLTADQEADLSMFVHQVFMPAATGQVR